MACRTVCVALLLSALPAAGCGTAANLVRSRPEQGGKVPFGGVKQDVVCIRRAADGELGLRAHPKSDAEQYPQAALMLFCAADLPLSLVGDVLTWPYTAAYSAVNEPIPVPPVVQATIGDPPQASR